MNEIRTISDISQLAAAGFNDWKRYGEVSVTPYADLLLFNYTPKAQFEGRWNFFETVSRGLIVSRLTGEIVARPFDKFFNWGEGGRTTNAPIVSVAEKMDGSLGILYRTSDGFAVATRGAFRSPQAVWATDHLNKNKRRLHILRRHLPEAYTLLFEIIYPDNRVVVDYGPRQDLVLLAVRDRQDGEYLSAERVWSIGRSYGFETPNQCDPASIQELLENLKTLGANQEGFVAEFADGQRFKFKGDEYLRLHRAISGLSFKSALEAVRDGRVSEVRSVVPDEFLGDFNGWVDEILATVDQVGDRVRGVFEAAPKEDRKAFALWVQKHHQPIASYLFAMLDGRDTTPMIYRLAFQNRKIEDEVQ